MLRCHIVSLARKGVVQKYRVLMTATSYPSNEDDWQGLFIRKIADAMGASASVNLSLWAPDGPRHSSVEYACDSGDAQWLANLSQRGGIAHLLRTSPISVVGTGLSLLRRLRRLYKQRQDQTDLYHINWLQNALPLYGLNAKAVITVLGADFNLLKLPGMVAMLRQVMKTNQCILAPNSKWMVQPLEKLFGDVARVVPVNFGIDDSWYEVACRPPAETMHWLCVLRVTQDKIGRLFDWGGDVFNQHTQLHLIGPNQGNLEIPSWVNYHGPTTAAELVEKWYPMCTGFITLSEHSEGKPQVLLETMAAGMPVIASKIAAHEETVSDGEHGYLVGSAQEFQQAISQICIPENYDRLSGNCRETSLSEYGTWRDCLDRYMELYGMLL
jgi:glycosyltransferase involved in cell wall biosynthesis